MCRFLLLTSEIAFDPHPVVSEFSTMCEVSRTPDGDRQDDGWGVVWKNEQGEWNLHKSLLPVWKDTRSFHLIPKTTLLVAHARSASYQSQEEEISYNQPYIDKKRVFAFNGMLEGVSIQSPGAIGAQKIFNLLKSDKTHDVNKMLQNLLGKLESHTKRIVGLNVGLGLVDSGVIAALCRYTKDSEYYTLWYSKMSKISFICSEPIGTHDWRRMQNRQIVVL